MKGSSREKFVGNKRKLIKVAEAFSCQSNFDLTEDRAYIIQFISGAQTSNTSGTELQILCDFTKLKIFRLVLSIK